jgi:hypothetical protein
MTLAVQAEARQRQLKHSTAAASRQQPPVQRAFGQTSATAPADDPMDVNAANVVPFNGKCYKCKERGHKAQDCPGPRQQQQQPRQQQRRAGTKP